MKGAIYVVFALLAIAVVVVVVALIVRVVKRAVENHHHNELADAKQNTRWEPFVSVGQLGELTIGIRRAVVFDGELHIFDGPITMWKLRADHDPVDMQVKVAEAKDRAATYNRLRS